MYTSKTHTYMHASTQHMHTYYTVAQHIHTYIKATPCKCLSSLLYPKKGSRCLQPVATEYSTRSPARRCKIGLGIDRHVEHSHSVGETIYHISTISLRR